MLRQIIKTSKRIVNKLYSFYNLIKFRLYGIKIKKNCCIHGCVGLTLDKSAKFEIGNDFYMSNGFHINPLCGNSQGHFHVENDAQLIIGNGVGASSIRIWCSKRINIGNHVKLGGNVIIIDTDAHSLNWDERRDILVDQAKKTDSSVVIEDDVFIGMNSIILKGVTIGARSIIGAGSVVTKSVPADCIAAGNPAKIIKMLK